VPAEPNNVSAFTLSSSLRFNFVKTFRTVSILTHAMTFCHILATDIYYIKIEMS